MKDVLIGQNKAGQLVGPLGVHDGSLHALLGVALAGKIAQALLDSRGKNVRVRVTYLLDNGSEAPFEHSLTGVIRSVVDETRNAGFVTVPWKPTDRLWLTDAMENFIPLQDIIDLEVLA